MTLAAILLVGAVVAAVAAPTFLERMPRYGVRPTVVLASWLAALLGVPFFLASAVAILFWPNHAPAEGIAEALVRCLTAVAHATRPWVGEVLAAVGAVALIVATTRIAVVALRYSRARTRMQDFHREVVAVVARTKDGRDDVLWLDHPLPMAYSVSGRPGFVVATDGLSANLTDGERDAVLAHERAHLRGHHHRIVGLCDVLAAVFPVVPLFARAPHAVKTVIELAADHQAARVTSPAALSSALTAVTAAALPQPAWSLGLGDDVHLRLRHLRTARPARSARLACCAAAMVTVTVPAVVALAMVLAFSAVLCILFA